MVRSFHKIVRSFHKKSQFVPHIWHIFSKSVNVIWVQSSDRNIDESIFWTIYITVRASYVNFRVHCGTIWELLKYISQNSNCKRGTILRSGLLVNWGGGGLLVKGGGRRVDWRAKKQDRHWIASVALFPSQKLMEEYQGRKFKRIFYKNIPTKQLYTQCMFSFFIFIFF